MYRIGLFTLAIIVSSLAFTLTVLGVSLLLRLETPEPLLIFTGIAIYCTTGALMFSGGIFKLTAIFAGVDKVNTPKNTTELWLAATITRYAKKLDIPTPQFGIFPSNYSTAFSVCVTRKRSMIALSRGLLFNFNEEEVETILAREVTNIASGTTSTLVLLQGIAAATGLLLVNCIAKPIDYILARHTGRTNLAEKTLYIVYCCFGGLIPVGFVSAYSRHRDYQTDRIALNLVSSTQIKHALAHLAKLKSTNSLARTFSPFCFATNKMPGILEYIACHPMVAKRIASLKRYQKIRDSHLNAPVIRPWW